MNARQNTLRDTLAGRREIECLGDGCLGGDSSRGLKLPEAHDEGDECMGKHTRVHEVPTTLTLHATLSVNTRTATRR